MTQLYIRDPPTHKKILIAHTFSRYQYKKINIQNLIVFLYTNNEHAEKNQKNNTIPNSLKN